MIGTAGLSFPEYLGALAVSALMVIPLSLGARRLRARLLPAFSGPAAWAAQVIAALLTLFVVAWLLGTIGVLDRIPVALGCLGAGATMWVLGAQPPGRATKANGRAPSVVTVAATALGILVVAAWVGRLTNVHRAGVTDVDSLVYHLPISARFLQDGSITALHHTGHPDGAFFPANGELFQSIAMLPTGTDLFSPIVNLGWLSLALLAAWCLGRSVGAPALTTAAVGVVLGMPTLVQFSGGTAQVDVMVLALILGAAVLLFEGPLKRAAVALAGAAAGLAVGTKMTAIVPAATLTAAAALVAPRALRVRMLAWWLAGLLGASSYWYVLNWVHTGNPLPFIGLKLGPVSLPQIPSPFREAFGFRVLDYAGDWEFWRRTVPEALRVGFGRLWPLLLLAASVGIIIGLRRGAARLDRWIAITAIASSVAYAMTPYTALGYRGRPEVAPNLRFLGLPLALGLIVLCRRAARSHGASIGIVLLLGSLLATSHPAVEGLRSTAAASAAFTALLGIPAFLWLRRPAGAGRALAALGIIALSTGALGFVAQDRYFALRYRTRGSSGAGVWSWAQGIRNARIAVIGYSAIYPLYGPDLSNRVQYAGVLESGGTLRPMRGCDEWRAYLHDGRWEYLIAGRALFQNFIELSSEDLPEARWTREDASADELERFGDTSIFRLDPAALPSGCAS